MYAACGVATQWKWNGPITALSLLGRTNEEERNESNVVAKQNMKTKREANGINSETS